MSIVKYSDVITCCRHRNILLNIFRNTSDIIPPSAWIPCTLSFSQSFSTHWQFANILNYQMKAPMKLFADQPHQWRSGFALKTGRREVPGSTSGRLTVRSFPWFSPKLALIRVRIPYKDPHGGHSSYSPKSFVWQLVLNLQPTNHIRRSGKYFTTQIKDKELNLQRA